MKIIRFTAFALLLAISFTVLVGCDDLRMRYYDPELYELTNDINPEFEANNRISVYYLPDDPEGENVPKSRRFIINDKETFDAVCSNPPFDVDFKKETVFLCVFPDADLAEFVLKNIDIENGLVKICVEELSNGLNSGCEPYQRWLAVKMRKSNASEVKFIKQYFYYYDNGYRMQDL